MSALVCDTEQSALWQVLGLVENMGGVCCPACGQGIQLFAPNTGVCPSVFEANAEFISEDN